MMSQGRTDINEGGPQSSAPNDAPSDDLSVNKIVESGEEAGPRERQPKSLPDQQSDGKLTRPTASQLKWLARGIDQAGGKLPLFDASGRKVSDRTVQSCIEKGWAEPWFNNPLKPDWQVCRLTEAGRKLVASGQ